MQRRSFLQVCCGLSLTLAACSAPSSPSSVEGTTPEGATATGGGVTEGGTTLWIAGMPNVVFGEGFLIEHQTATDPSGPWSRSEVVEFPQDFTPMGNQIYRARVRRQHHPELMDMPDSSLVIEEILETQRGGPALQLIPGVGVGSLWLRELAAMEGADNFGPLRTEAGPTPAIRFSLHDVPGVLLGESLIQPGDTIDEIATHLGDCERIANRGATHYRCDGLVVTHAGVGGSAENIHFTVVPEN